MKRSLVLFGLSIALILGGCFDSKDQAQSNTPPRESQSATSQAMKGMMKDTGITASDQPENEADRKIVQQIRQAVTKDESLSTRAHNVTIVSRNGNVTLRGAVKDKNEKEQVTSKAQQVDGVTKVDNQFVVTQ